MDRISSCEIVPDAIDLDLDRAVVDEREDVVAGQRKRERGRRAGRLPDIRHLDSRTCANEPHRARLRLDSAMDDPRAPSVLCSRTSAATTEGSSPMRSWSASAIASSSSWTPPAGIGER
jgi:hypothetical protein